MYVSPPHRREPQKTSAAPPASAGRQMAHTFATGRRAGRPGGAIIRPGAASRGRAGRRLAAGAVVRGT